MFLNTIIFFIAGVLRGTREAYHADNSILEWVIKGTDTDYFGAKSWLNKYKEFEVSKGFKSIFSKYFPMDFEHNSDDLFIPMIMIGGFMSDSWIMLGVEFVGMAIVVLITYGLLRK